MMSVKFLEVRREISKVGEGYISVLIDCPLQAGVGQREHLTPAVLWRESIRLSTMATDGRLCVL